MENNVAQNPQAQAIQVAQEENVLDLALKIYRTYVRPYFWIYPSSLVLFLLGGIIVLFSMTPKFRSTCRMQISNQKMNTLDVRDVMDTRYNRMTSFIQTQMTILGEPFIEREAYRKLGKDGMESESFRCSHPRIRQVEETDLVDISIDSNNPEAAATLANAVANAYIAFMKDLKGDISSSGAELLKDQLKDAELNRDRAMGELLAFKEEHGIFNFQQRYSTLNAQVNSLTEKIFDCEMEEKEIGMTIEAIKANRKVAAVMLPYLMYSTGESRLSSIQMMLLNHRMKLPELLMQYSEQHQVIKNFHAVTKFLEDAAEQEVDISMQGLEMRRSRAHVRKEQYQKLIGEITEQIVALDKLNGAYKQREALCDSYTNTCQQLVNRINEISIAAATTKIDKYSISIIEPAVKADKPIYPVPRKVLFISLFLGLALAAGISFVLATLDVNVGDLETVKQALGEQLPVFGSLPKFADDEQTLLKTSGNERVDLAFQNIRTSLNLSLLTRGSHLLAVSSSIPSEGKTFVVSQLARSFARDNKRVLLLDLDLRLPRVGKLLKDFVPEEQRKRGVSNVLVGDCELKDVVVHVDALGIDVLFSGPQPPNPNELLGSPALGRLLRDAESQYDLTMIDTPPIMPVTDTMLILKNNVPLLLTVRLGHAIKPVLRHLREYMEQLGIQPAGVIVNCTPEVEQHYGNYKYGYGKHRYGYGYGYGGYGYGYGGYGYGYGHHHHHHSDKDGDNKVETSANAKPEQTLSRWQQWKEWLKIWKKSKKR